MKRGENAKLTCEVYGALPLTIKWFAMDFKHSTYKELNLNAEEFPFPRIKSSIEHRSPGPSAVRSFVHNNLTVAQLIIHGVSAADNGRYQCHAQNEFGKAVRTIDLLVQDVPGTVPDVQISQIWSRDISLHWYTPDVSGNSALTGYTVQYWKELKSSGGGSGGQQLHELEVTPTEKQTIIRNLTPGTAYVVRVIASNRFGQGAPSVPVRVITAEETPNAAPIDIHVEAVSTASLRIRWKAPPRSHWNGQLRGYYLGYRLSKTSTPTQDTDDSNDVNNDGNGFSYKEILIHGEPSDALQEEFLLTDLQRATKYW